MKIIVPNGMVHPLGNANHVVKEARLEGDLRIVELMPDITKVELLGYKVPGYTLNMRSVHDAIFKMEGQYYSILNVSVVLDSYPLILFSVQRVCSYPLITLEQLDQKFHNLIRLEE